MVTIPMVGEIRTTGRDVVTKSGTIPKGTSVRIIARGIFGFGILDLETDIDAFDLPGVTEDGSLFN